MLICHINMLYKILKINILTYWNNFGKIIYFNLKMFNSLEIEKNIKQIIFMNNDLIRIIISRVYISLLIQKASLLSSYCLKIQRSIVQVKKSS